MEDDIVLALEDANKTLTRDLKYIQEKDWTTIKLRIDKESVYKRQHNLTERAIERALAIYLMCRGGLLDENVKETLKKLLSMHEIFEARVDMYLETTDWSADIEDIDKVAYVDNEISFQSDIQKALVKLKSNYKKIHIEDNGKTVEIKTLDDVPIPLLMREAFENENPKLKALMVAKLYAEQQLKVHVPGVGIYKGV